MVSFHKVREHFRKNTPDGVREYTRGQGSSAQPYQGEFQGTMSSRPETQEKKPGFFDSLKAKAQARIGATQKKIQADKKAKEESKRFSENISEQIKKEEAEKERIRKNEAFIAETRAEAERQARLGKHYKLKGALRSGAKGLLSQTNQALKTSRSRPRTRKTKRKRQKKQTSVFSNY